MIVSASRRTDIPAFYAKWFLNRLRAGFCEVRNPFNPRISTRVSLAPEDVDAFVFWTRYARPFERVLPVLDSAGYPYYFLFTVTNYGRELEPHMPPLEARISSLRRLSERLGPQRVVWRYDPVLVSRRYGFRFHLQQFEKIARALAGAADTAIVSLVDYYRKTKRNLAPLNDAFDEHPERRPDFGEFVSSLADIARQYGMRIQSCAEEVDLRPYGVAPGKCIDDARLRRVFGIEVDDRKDPHQRPACGCVVSRDIGAYNSCPYGCRYCYATADAAAALRFLRNHDPEAPYLG